VFTRSLADAYKPARRHVTYLMWSTSTFKVWWRLVDPQLSYCALSIFKMAAVFKFALISSSSCKIW